MNHSRPRHLVALMSAVLVVCLIGIYWRPLGQLSALWPANAVLLGLFLRSPGLAAPTGWFAAAAGYIAADLLTGSSVLWAATLSVINLLSVSVALRLCRGLSPSERHSIAPGALARLLLAMAVASVVAGLLGGLLIWQMLGKSFWSAAANWAVSELLAYIIVLPSVLSAPDPRKWKLTRPAHLSAWLKRKFIIVLWLLLTLVAGVIIGGPGVVAFPVSALLVCALSCGMFTTAIMTLAFSLWTLLGTTFGHIELLFDSNNHLGLLSMRLGVASVALAPIVVASVMASRERSLDAMRHLAEHDALTGLLNRRAFFERVRHQLSRLIDQQQPAALLMIDMDHFKQINDRYGHAAGDAVLRSAARKLRDSLRGSDVCGRLGGEEFAVLIPRCTPALLERITSRIHQVPRHLPVTLDKGREAVFRLSVSIGATYCQGPSDDLTSMLSRADQAMYAAKQGGRDQTRIA